MTITAEPDARSNRDFAHVVLTRFNVGLDATTREGTAWLQERVALFERFTLPTMLGQSVRPHVWMLFCDSSAGSPDWFRARVRDYESRGLSVAWVPQMTLSAYQDAARRSVPPGIPWVITTRLDNDDAVSRDFIGSVQANFRAEKEVLNFTIGLQYANRRIYWRLDPRGPFASLVEPAEAGISTVYAREHSDLGAVAPVRQIRGRPVWLQVVHERNLGNLVAGIEGPSARALSGFDLALDVARPRLSGVLRSTLHMALKVATRPSRWLRLFRSIRR